ncbi:carcinoembryonic antigen-related cell adhesion molecule 5 isoform X2 [Mugil cephalus]|nr:carcinoembryonic antigen-related cell adhesion molecule 5 isoform X2 [Mugil cephalus]
MLITRSHGGFLECEARAQNNSEITPSVSSPHYLKVVEPVKNTQINNSGPVEVQEGKNLHLHCHSTGTDVSYKWLRNGLLISQSDNELNIYRVTPEDSGSYMCMATNVFNNTQVFTSNSSEVVVTIKEPVVRTDITYTVLKDDFQAYYAMVTCNLIKGPVPVIFTLYNGTQRVDVSRRIHERHHTFKVHLIPGNTLMLMCSATSGDQRGTSQWLPVKVVPVHGPVTVSYKYSVGENKALVLRFYCKVASGSHPRYQWFLNKTLLQNEGSFYRITDDPSEQSVLEMEKKKRKRGRYHCEVSDSFDNTTAISSTGYLVNEEVPNQLSAVFVAAIVFGSFALAILLVSACCWTGVLQRWRLYGKTSLRLFEMERTVAAYEDELELAALTEDPDIVLSADEDAFDQTSEASEDEWPQIEKEKKTIEDEPVQTMFAL